MLKIELFIFLLYFLTNNKENGRNRKYKPFFLFCVEWKIY